MERDFNSDEFEQFLQNKTEQYKIYPSERSWKKIYNTLHPGRSWFRIGGGLLLLTGFFFASQKLFFNNTANKTVDNKVSPTPSTARNTLKAGSNIDDAPVTSPVQYAIAGPVSRNVSAGVNLKRPVVMEQQRVINAYPPAGRSVVSEKLINTERALSRINVPGPISGDIASAENSSTEVDTEEVNIEPQSLENDESWLSGQFTPIRITSRKSKLGLQFYFSPTISYRRLADNKYGNAAQRNIPLATNYLNIDRFVDHNPSIGAEFGSNVLWKAGRNLTIKTGVQLNYSRYSIKAYKFYFEKASIALNPLGRKADTLTSYTPFRNFSGYSPEILQNQYLQVSVPIGAELKVLGNKRLQLNVAGTIQPSYLLFNETYLLSTDYVNYAKEPSLVQKWNIHTSFETFISYKVAGVRWQVGPQFRYQMLSTYNDRYPIKEYLMEYGVKVGVSKTLK